MASQLVGVKVGYTPRPGWRVLTIHGLDHLVSPQGQCKTCGRRHA